MKVHEMEATKSFDSKQPDSTMSDIEGALASQDSVRTY